LHTNIPLETDSGRLLRKHSGLLIYDKTERVLAITKQMLNYYNTNFLIKMAFKKEKHWSKTIFRPGIPNTVH